MEYGDVIQTKASAPFSAEGTEGILAKMAKYPEVEITVIRNKNSSEHKNSDTTTHVNGNTEKTNSDAQDEYTSDEELLIIDEPARIEVNRSNSDRKKIHSPFGRANFKGFKKRIYTAKLSFSKLIKDLENSLCLVENEKLPSDYNCDTDDDSQKQGELNNTVIKDSVLFQNNRSHSGSKIRDDDTYIGQKSNFSKKLLSDVNLIADKRADSRKFKHTALTSSKVASKKPVKKRPSQKLTEYAQYLGLQPAVKFKCVKCSESSFPSLSVLNDHQRQCLAQPAVSKPPPPPSTATSSTAPSTNFRVTRKVFLCSSCGTYYENCNLFLHMREVHKRYICLYCLGMFSFPEKLSHHLMTKHNCSPSKYSSANEFLNSNTESCYLICCNCERVFSERDNFFDHVCLEKRTIISDKTSKIPVDQHLNSQGQKFANKTTAQKSADKRNKSARNITKNYPHVEHVTADSPVTHMTSPVPEQEANVAEHFMAEINTSHLKTLCEDPALTTTETHSPCAVNQKEEHIVPLDISKTADTTDTKEANQQTEENTERKATVSEESKMDEKESEKMICSDNELTDENKRKDTENIMSEKSTDSVTQMASGSDENNSDLEVNDNNNCEQKDEIISETNDNEPISKSPDSKFISDELAADNKSSSMETEENKETADKVNQQDAVDETEDTRKVPKVTLKLPPQGIVYSENESDDSEKLTMEIEENGESDGECDESQNGRMNILNESGKPVNGFEENEDENIDFRHTEDEEYYQVAGEEVPVVELELEQPLDKFQIGVLLKTCLDATVPTCVYCNHARKIAVNGKQLGLHAMAEHRFAATVNSITAEELIPENFVARIKESLGELESSYFSLEEKTTEEIKEDDEDNSASSFKRIYECFQCRYVTAIHKELYLHNRKMHAKTILLCIMCKSNFYSYSELICHLCPGNYILNSEMRFRCCMCDSNDLPSAFRLMVHLRKRHHTCDVCLEGCNNQSKLSNHVWKHKLHHLCYRCGIAYRNKPDITKHLFWKHGTESVLCKKCLQKKWPHVYHFCIPPNSFACEECNLNFSKAVYLKVHKRLHNNEKPHACTEENCTDMFISKKLMFKHERRHREPESEVLENPQTKDEELEKVNVENITDNVDNNMSVEDIKQEKIDKNPSSPEKEEQKPKNIIDVYDLPALNLSESDSDDSEDEKFKTSPATPQTEDNKPADISEDVANINTVTSEPSTLEEEQKPIPILDGIWDNFKNYQATIEKRDLNTDLPVTDEKPIKSEISVDIEPEEKESIPELSVILAEHDYCIIYDKNEETENEVCTKLETEQTTGMDHDYCTVSTNEIKSANLPVSNANTNEEKPPTPANSDKKKTKTAKKKASKHTGSSSSSESSSDSDSSSCTCGSNCSCSSSSGSSTSSSTSSDSDSSSSEGKRRIAARRERRKERAKRKKESETSQAASNNSAVDVVATEDATSVAPQIELPIQESDLDTDETETDEDFYDEHPQRLANKLLAEKRNQLAILAAVAPVSNGTIIECSRPSTPSIPEEMTSSRKKIKSKKRKKKSRSSTPKQELQIHNIPDYLNHHSPLTVQPPLPIAPSIPQVIQPLVTHQPVINPPKPDTSKPMLHNAGSGSETDTNVRSSKRKRVPNKFYGYSSDEETNEKAPTLKWRKLELPSTPIHVTGSPHLVPPITIRNIPSPAPIIEPVRAPVIHHGEVIDSDSDDDDMPQHKSSSDSSDTIRNDSDSDTGQLHISQPGYMMPRQGNTGMQSERTNENLYCYCQCPYDEVSEMIACDGKDCAIEWFHFECVGIMVPPKGKWYCPDCRKKMQMQRSDIQT